MTHTAQDWIVIGISGVTCGGKTTLANRLKEALSPVYVFHQDKYFYPDDSPKHVKCEGLDHNNYDILSSLDMDTMLGDILKTMRGENKAHRFSAEEGKFEIKGKKFMVIEGFTVLNFKPILELCHLRYYFVLEYSECVTRRCYRLYDPPDIDGYFDQCVWPEHIKYRAEIEKDKRVKLLDGTKQDSMEIVMADLKSLDT
ncbi:nicotinamide riboside kinase 2 [Manduca sexta]|uniref:nicotinamide riboside kinase 2 n=1 Tax=Manduca sexta TaxID=7130 RepID=UPI001183BCA1|nr:nicotinamide riboside kinase 2 [Manduca sexta]XP_030028701.1 nicotinamide riboside kinase 2 [Manduca sexta]